MRSQLSKLPAELAHSLQQAYAHNSRLNAFTSLLSPAGLSSSMICSGSILTILLPRQDAIAAYTAAKSDGKPLNGVAVGVKDVFCAQGLPTTAASRMLKEYVSPLEATVVERLKAAGGVVVGKTNMDEFGMGSENKHSHFGPVMNPSGPPEIEGADGSLRVAGGSSGGSAAAVAAGMCEVALASDTGGSTRLPAAYCGVVGLKPSYGLLSRWGMIAYASSLDCVGIMAKEVDTVRTTLDVLSAYDEKDPTSASLAARQRIEGTSRWAPNGNRTNLKGLRIGIPAEYFLAELSPQVLPPFRQVLDHLKSMGATLSSVSIPSTPLSLSAYYVIASAEASSNLARYDGVRFGFRSSYDIPPVSSGAGERSPLYAATRSEGFGEEVKKRILLGTHALSAEAFDNYYLQAQRIRQLLRTEFDNVFRSPSPLYSPRGSHTADLSGVDILLHPSAIDTAPLLVPIRAPNATAGYVQDILNVPASLAGLPAVSVPAGVAQDGWPVGVQVVGQWGADDLVLAVGEAIQSS